MTTTNRKTVRVTKRALLIRLFSGVKNAGGTLLAIAPVYGQKAPCANYAVHWGGKEVDWVLLCMPSERRKLPFGSRNEMVSLLSCNEDVDGFINLPRNIFGAGLTVSSLSAEPPTAKSLQAKRYYK